VNRDYLRKDVLSFLIPWTLTMFAAGALSAWEFVGREFVFTPVTVLSLFLGVIGFVLIIVAHVTLWRWYSSFLVIRDGHQLIRHGIYRYLRHPIYTGTVAALIGMPLFLSSVYGFATMLLIIPLFLNRIRMEEEMLIGEFGADYIAYMEKTKRLIPFVY
jgi:protein-S-isoprenylcysteine O-methyltransferase Ste14